MGRTQNWAVVSRALREGVIVTPEIRAEFNRKAAEKRATKEALKIKREAGRAAREARRAELERTAPDRAKWTAARNARRTQCENERNALKALAIGAGLTLNYTFSSQLGPMLARLRILDGMFYTCRAITGQGVYVERINPPYAAPASSDPNADLL